MSATNAKKPRLIIEDDDEEDIVKTDDDIEELVKNLSNNFTAIVSRDIIANTQSWIGVTMVLETDGQKKSSITPLLQMKR